VTRRGAMAPPLIAPPWRFAWVPVSPARVPTSRIALVIASIWLVACTTVPPATPAGAGDVLSGRLALRVEPLGSEAPRALSAAFDLRGDPSAGTLGLSTPLGSMLAQARWSPAEVVLTTPRETRRFASLDALTREALGESVPIEAWFDWLRGRPWPGAPSAPVEIAPSAPAGRAPDASLEMRAPGFRQLGWRVDLAQFGEGTISATREAPAPVVTVRIRLDRS
jgi:outer membrane lipoprotein LolB